MNKRKMIFFGVSSALMLTILGAAVFGQGKPAGDVYRHLSIFSEVFALVRNSYVEEVPASQLVDGAFTGVTDAIDEYSYYVPPALMPAYKQYEPGASEATGLIIAKRYGYAYVIAPIAGSPAAKAGVEPGDFLEQVDGKPTQDLAVWQIEQLLQSAPGRELKIGLIRAGVGKREEVRLQPAKFEPPAPELEYHGAVAYIRIPYFSPGSAATFAKHLAAVREAGRKKLIVDLRKNAGGSFDEAIKATDELLVSGMITSVAGRRTDARKWNADSATGYDGEVKVLTDGSTAGGAEVMAASIRENQRGNIVGLPTYGRAIVQKFIPLESGGGLYMTIGHYTTPAAKAIEEQGIKPDQTVDVATNSLRADGEEHDLILEEALRLFGEKPARPIPEKAAA